MAGVQEQHVFLHDDGMFSSPNASTLPTLLTLSILIHRADFMDPQEVQEPLWSSQLISPPVIHACYHLVLSAVVLVESLPPSLPPSLPLLLMFLLMFLMPLCSIDSL